MTILILFFFNFNQKTWIEFYKLSFCFFYLNYILRIPTPIPRIATLIPRISTLIPVIPTLTPRIPTLIPSIPIIPTLIPRIPTLILHIPIIPFIPFPDSPFRLLHIAQGFDVLASNYYLHIKHFLQKHSLAVKYLL